MLAGIDAVGNDLLWRGGSRGAEPAHLPHDGQRPLVWRSNHPLGSGGHGLATGSSNLSFSG